MKMIQHVTSAKDFRYLKESMVNFSAEIILNFSMLAIKQKIPMISITRIEPKLFGSCAIRFKDYIWSLNNAED